MIRRLAAAATAFALTLPLMPAAYAQETTAPAAEPSAADAGTLADLRAELKALAGSLQGLRAELNASGVAGFAAAGGDSAIDRMNAMEAEIARLTGRTEQLQNRISRIVTDGTRRIGDIEFRLCEMDPSCDLGALMTQPELGSLGSGGAPTAGGASLGQTTTSGGGTRPGGATSAAEQADFDRAQEVLGQGDFRRAAELFAAVAQTHAGGPLTAEALFLRGSALDSAGDPGAAAAAWLESFAASPDGPRAAESLLGLGRIIAGQGDPQAACLYLAEIPARFPGHAAVAQATERMAELNCGATELPGDDTGMIGGDGAEGLPIDPEEAADLADQD